ncbi:MAG: AAA family ATPase [Halobacteriaceae archaeon]
MTATPALLVVCGPPGVGKTTVAETLQERLDARLLRTDLIRKELFPEPEYTDSEEAAVYGELLDRAVATLRDDRAVVLDGTFHDRAYREEAATVASEAGADCQIVRVTCEEDVVAERMRNREGDASDATFEIHMQFRECFDPVQGEHMAVDNSGTLEETLAQVRGIAPRGVEAE